MKKLVSVLMIASAFVVSTAALSSTLVKSVYSLPLTLDPIRMNDTASLVVGNLIYDGLVKFSPKLSIHPAIAESWTTSSDGKTITFKLRTNAQFHDGNKITAEDVKFSLVRALSAESKVRAFYTCIEGAESGKPRITTPDSHTVVIKLVNPFPPFLSVLAGATAKILPKSLVNRKDFFEKPVGSGPFQYGELNTSEKKIILKAFSQHYLGGPKLQRIELLEQTEAVAIAEAKKGGVHDLANWPLASSNDIFKIGNQVTSPTASTWIIGLNTSKPPFDKIEVRRAFKNAIDVEKFRRTFYPDALRASGYVPFGLPGAGVVSNSSLPESRISKQKITLVIPAELARAEEMKEFLEHSLKNVGWNLEVQILKWKELMSGYSEKRHQAFLVAMNMDYPDAEFLLRNFESSNSDNFSSIKSEKLDSLIAKSRTLQDRNEREKVYAEALQHLDSLALTVNLFYPRANAWISKCVSGFEPNILSDVYIDYSKVSVNKPCLDLVADR